MKGLKPILFYLLFSLVACGEDEAFDRQRAPATNAEHSMSMGSTVAAAGDSEATKRLKRSMQDMMVSAPPYTGDADIDFAKQMRVHHEAAVSMAEVELASGTDPEMRKLAEDIISAQRSEIAQIDKWLIAKGTLGD